MAIGRIYKVPLLNLSVTNDSDQDIWELVNGSTVTVELHEFFLESALTTDERVLMRLLRRSTTGSGGTGLTEVPTDPGNSVAAAAALSSLVTAPGTSGAVLDGFYWSQLGPKHYLPTPEPRIVVPPSGRLALNLQSAVGATRSWSGYVTWEEKGG